MALLTIEEIRDRLAYTREPSAVPSSLLQATLNAAEAVIVKLYGEHPDPLHHTYDRSNRRGEHGTRPPEAAQTEWVSLDLRGLYTEKDDALRTNMGLPTELC